MKRHTPPRADDPGDWDVIQLSPLARMSQEESATRQLADVQNLAWEKQTLAKDRRQNVGVFSRAHGSEKNDLRVDTRLPGKRSRCPLENLGRGVGALGTESEALQVLRRDPRVRGKEAIGHRDDMHPLDMLRGPREGTCVFQLAAKVQSAQEAEDLAQRGTFLAYTSCEDTP